MDLLRTSFADRLLTELDTCLRTVASPARAGRASPADQPGTAEDDGALAAGDRDLSARLMRVNHAGEIAAQALYRGQAFVARDEGLRRHLLDAAAEEHDHLAWCEARVARLGRRTSLLGPAWYAGGFAIGAAAGLAGERTSLGFLAETERQVADHLEGHLGRLPEADTASRRIVERMQLEEIAHGRAANRGGGVGLPRAIRAAMAGAARVMTAVSFWL